jgi:radical SAM superfamily enzyme
MNNYNEYFVYGRYDYPVLLNEMCAQYESLMDEAENILISLGRLPNKLPEDTLDYFEQYYATDAVILKNITDALAAFKENNSGNIDVIEASEDYAHYLEYYEQWKKYQ